MSHYINCTYKQAQRTLHTKIPCLQHFLEVEYPHFKNKKIEEQVQVLNLPVLK